jgi:hypothetical protein
MRRIQVRIRLVAKFLKALINELPGLAVVVLLEVGHIFQDHKLWAAVFDDTCHFIKERSVTRAAKPVLSTRL